MAEVNFDNLPEQQGYVIDVEKLSLWDYVAKDEDPEGAVPQLNYAYRSDSLDVVWVNLPPGTLLPWHTHEPHTSQVYWVVEGSIRTNYKDTEGEIHTVESSAGDNELVFLPAGAHNQLENAGDEMAKVLSFKDGGGSVIGRLEHILGNPSKHYDPKTIPPAGIEFQPRRGRVFEKDENAVKDW